MKLKLLAAATIALVFSQSDAKAVNAFYTGNDLLEMCTQPKSSVRRGMCVGLVAAVSDMMEDRRKQYGYVACFPRAVTTDQLTDVVVRTLRNAPHERHLTAVSLVADAFATAFPCP